MIQQGIRKREDMYPKTSYLKQNPVPEVLLRSSRNGYTGHLQKKLRKNPRGVGMKKEEEKAVWKKLVYPIWRVL